MKTLRRPEKPGNRLLDFSPWILAAACTLLLALLSLFAVNNYQREKQLVMEALTQKGLTLMRFINSSVREAIRDNLRSSEQWISWDEQMLTVMQQAVEQPGVEFVALADAAGNVLAGAGTAVPENKIDTVTFRFAKRLSDSDGERFVTRIINNNQADNKKFQIASWYLPPDMGMGGGRMHRPPRGPRGEQMMRRFSQHPQFTVVQQEIARLRDLRPVYLVQLDFEQFSSPLKRQILQIIILLVVIFLVGVGGMLSFVTLKGLKGSQFRLGTMRAFNEIMVSSLPIGLLATDSSGVIQVYNSSARELLGSDEKKIVGMMPDRSLPKALAEMFTGYVKGSEKERQREAQLYLRPDKASILQLTCVIVEDESGVFAGEVLLIRDLTMVKHLEKELQRSERLAVLGKMAAGVAHELRNPLSSIKGLALLLKSYFPTVSDEAETADILIKEVERLNRSIGELLDYARPGQLSKEAASLEEIIEKTVSLVQVDAESYGIDIQVETVGVCPPVMVDKDKMNQVFLNLFLNAIQAMEGGGKLDVLVENDKGETIVTVRDNGIGIEKENLGRLFDPYYTTKSDGTGLGLAMSSKIVEGHGGRIEINSVAGEYTAVRVVLPG